MSDFTINRTPPASTFNEPIKAPAQQDAPLQAAPAQQDTAVQAIGATDGTAAEQARKSDLGPSYAMSTNITTYRDNDTGHLVVRLVDNANNELVTQFPSVGQLSLYPKLNDFNMARVLNEEA